MSDHSDQGLPRGVDGHSHSGTDDLRSGSFTSPVAVNTGPLDPATPDPAHPPLGTPRGTDPVYTVHTPGNHKHQRGSINKRPSSAVLAGSTLKRCRVSEIPSTRAGHIRNGIANNGHPKPARRVTPGRQLPPRSERLDVSLDLDDTKQEDG